VMKWRILIGKVWYRNSLELNDKGSVYAQKDEVVKGELIKDSNDMEWIQNGTGFLPLANLEGEPLAWREEDTRKVDSDDDVVRCTRCGWEIEEGEGCQCQLHAGDTENESEELEEHEISDDMSDSVAARVANGSTAEQLVAEGYSTERLVPHFSRADLMAAGAEGLTASALKSCGYDACALKDYGFTARELRDGGFSWKQVLQGFTVAELIADGLGRRLKAHLQTYWPSQVQLLLGITKEEQALINSL